MVPLRFEYGLPCRTTPFATAGHLPTIWNLRCGRGIVATFSQRQLALPERLVELVRLNISAKTIARELRMKSRFLNRPESDSGDNDGREGERETNSCFRAQAILFRSPYCLGSLYLILTMANTLSIDNSILMRLSCSAHGQERLPNFSLPSRSSAARETTSNGGSEQNFPAKLVVILQSQVRNQFLPTQMPQCVLQLHGLNEQVVLGIESRSGHRRLKVKA